MEKIHKQNAQKDYSFTIIRKVLCLKNNSKSKFEKRRSNFVNNYCKDDEIKEIKYKTEKCDYEYVLKSLKSDSESSQRKYKTLNEKKVFMIDSKILNRTVGLGDGLPVTISG